MPDRPPAFLNYDEAHAAGGSEGTHHILGILCSELGTTMAFLGATIIDDLRPLQRMDRGVAC